MKIHLWAPGMDGSHGGIQAYSWEVYQSLCEILGEDNITAFSLSGVQATNKRIFDFGEFSSPLQKAAFTWSVAKYAFIEKPDFIFITHGNLAPIANFLRKILRVSYGASIHGVEISQFRSETKRDAISSARKIFPVSKWTRDMLLKDFPLLKDRCDLLPNTFDEARFTVGSKSSALLERYKLSSDAKIILTVARLDSNERYKGIDNVLSALKNVVKRVQNCHYLVAGRGDDLPRLREEARLHDLEGRVIFCGFVSAEELPEHYRLCDVYAMPSKGEGFGITYLEALASGKPVLAGNQDASREAILEGDLGVLVNPDDPAEIENSLVALLEKTHPNQSLFNPEWLRAEVIRAYGRKAFTETLERILTTK